jgi:hypothetical protein
MRKRPHSWYSKLTLAAAGLTGCAMLLGAPQLRADDCQKQTQKAVHDWNKAVEHEGTKSDAAKYAKHEVREAQQACWDREHRWWDPNEHRWHYDKDFDDMNLNHPDNH